MDIIPMDDSVFEQRYFQYIQRCEKIAWLKNQKQQAFWRILCPKDTVTLDQVRSQYPNHERRLDLNTYIDQLLQQNEFWTAAFWRVIQSWILDDMRWKQYPLVIESPLIMTRLSITEVRIEFFPEYLRIMKRRCQMSSARVQEWNNGLLILSTKLHLRYPHITFTPVYLATDASR